MTDNFKNADQSKVNRRDTLGLLPTGAMVGSAVALLTQLAGPADAAEQSHGSGQVLRIDCDQSLGTSGPMGAAWQVPGSRMPQGAAKPLFASEDKRFSISLFEAAPGLVRLLPYPEDEFWILLKGEVDFTNAQGQTVVFRAGDTFLVPKGFSGVSRIIQPMRKLAISYRPV